ncbi:MAG: hypothetical protein ACTH2Q_20960 [Propionibacteriaceae bacterium]
MQLLTAIRLTTHLNALRHGLVSPEVAARTVVGADTAHHVVDPEGLLGLDTFAANGLEEALVAAGPFEPEGWVLTLPRPGALGALRGPAEMTTAALEAGAAVIGLSGSLAFVPHVVGTAVQWQVFPANRPFPPPSPYESERELAQAVLTAGTALEELDRIETGDRPELDTPVVLPAGYSPRQQSAATRAHRLVQACELALDDDSGVLSSHAIERRQSTLRELLAAASAALCAACTWVD